MSLINKVLTDLDQRGAVDGVSDERLDNESTLNDLRYSQLPEKKTNILFYVTISAVVLVVAVSIITGFYLFHRPPNENMADNVMPANLSESRNVAMIQSQSPEETKSINKTIQITAIQPSRAPAENTITATKSPKKKVENIERPAVKNKIPEKELVIADVKHVSKTDFNKSTVPLRSEQRAELAYQSAYDYLTVRNTHKAEQSLRRALAFEPNHVKSRELLSGVYIKQGRWVEASTLLRNGLKLSPGHTIFTKLYARALMQLKQDKRAISVMQQYLPQIKSDPDYYAILAALYQRQNNHSAAANTYQKIVELQPNNGVWWVGLGISLEALGESQQAIQAYQQASKSGNLQNEIARFTNNRLVALDEIGYPSH